MVFGKIFNRTHKGGGWRMNKDPMHKDGWMFDELEESIKKGKTPVIWWGEDVILPSIISKILRLISLETKNLLRQRIVFDSFNHSACHVKLFGSLSGKHLIYDFTISKDGSILDAKVLAWKQAEAEDTAAVA